MDYKSIIEAAYNRKNWQELLHDIFANRIQFWATPSKVPTTNDIAQSAYYLAKITLADGKMIAVYEVKLADSVILERNKVSIRNLLVQHWKNNGFAGAFMFCYKNNESVLRFSYVSEVLAFNEDGKLATEATDTKRFTYYLGEGHRSRTAIDQFTKLKGSGQTLDDITKAFSIEAVSDAFFAGYKNIYEDIVEYMTGKRMTKVGNKWEEVTVNNGNPAIVKEFSVFENPLKSMRDYAKKLLGRLVFLQFIQKKGWLGVKKNAEWGTGDKEFMSNLFANSKQKDNFIDKVLEPLFNDINTQRDGDLVSDKNVGTDIKVPFLNGGLFERDKEDETTIKLPAKYFERLFDFFSQYNFTIDENDPNDTEVGVDPEMLGRIFENLLEDNKDKGAFYTPKEIVRYMCAESLIAYLQTDIAEETDKDAIRNFVATHEVRFLNERLIPIVKQKLKDVKICDPAIGSGAFPIGLLNELFACVEALEGEQANCAEIKKHIIEHSIYGVDIEKGAVDIARLRFWLSLVVDEDKPDALPNLDFKIMQGNSLLEQYSGVDLSQLVTGKEVNMQMDIFDSNLNQYRSNLNNLIKEYFNTKDHAQKLNLKKQIQENVNNQMKEADIDVDFNALGIDVAGNDKFFLWHTWFADVFNRPILRGRDIKRYGYDWAELYLIATFPSRHYDIDDYPAVKEHLLSFGKERLEQTGKEHIIGGQRIKARKKTNNKWFETQDSISYWEDFMKPKIIWKRIGSILRFSYDEESMFGLDSTCFATGKHIMFLTGILNSNMGMYLLKDSPKTGTGDLLVSVQALEPIKVPYSMAAEEQILQLVDMQLDSYSINIENELNSAVYSLFRLTSSEIDFVEKFVTQFQQNQ